MRVFALGCLALVLVAHPQSSPVGVVQDVSGVVTDTSGAMLAGVTVTLEASDGKIRTATTDSSGAFRFTGVPIGRVEIKAELAGFRRVTRVFDLQAGQAARIALVLLASAIRETVAVAAQAPAASPEQTYRSRIVTGGGAGAHVLGRAYQLPSAPWNTEAYDRIEDNAFHRVTDAPLSTFSIDVDTASYANVRRFLNQGSLPPADAVRSEELINYFKFDYPSPAGNDPFSITTEVASCPWNRKHRLALVGLQTRRLEAGATPPRNLVFLLDVSGSMMPPDKLPLVKTAMRMLVDTLTAKDRVAIVVYAGSSGLVLPATPGDRKERIHQAIDSLEAGGSTNGAAGIQLAYDVAAAGFVKDGINRVILATDGDFNVGVTSQGELVRLIEDKRAHGIFLSVLGVGTGNLKDSTMEKLADKGNGNYAYLDSVHEARRVLIAEAGATLVTVAKDVKIQVEFNPAAVNAYRLIGYENRILQKEDFNDDTKDAGEIGAGHAVTALYEIVPAGVAIDLPAVDPLKYQPRQAEAHATTDELMTVKVRYKDPDGTSSRLTTVAVRNRAGDLSPRVGFAASLAQFGMLLRGSEHRGAATWQQTADLARRYRGDDPDGYRAEFIRLVDLAATLAQHRETTTQR